MANLGQVLTQLDTLYNMAGGFLPAVASQLKAMREDLIKLEDDIKKLPKESRVGATKALNDIVNFIHPKAEDFIKNMNFAKISQLQLDAQNAQQQIDLLKANLAANLAKANKSASAATSAPSTPAQTPSPKPKATPASKNILGNLFSGKSGMSSLLQAVYDLVKNLFSLLQNFLGGKMNFAQKQAPEKPLVATDASIVAGSDSTPSETPKMPSTRFDAGEKQPKKTVSSATSMPISGKLEHSQHLTNSSRLRKA